MLYIENPVPNDIVRRRKPQYIILLDGVLSLSLPNVYQKQPGTVAVPGLFALGMPGVSTRCLPTSLFAALLCHLELHVGGNPSFFMACKGRHTPLGFKIQKEEIQMRNLKRALSLALAAIMLIGMMVVSASAVSYNDLTDKDQIVNKDAVSMLVTLGVIEGKPDGSYAPTEGVDRAQMAKMISVIMNQGVDNGALYENSPSGLTDISSHWAKGHINYCYTTGIIAGRGNGKFDPDAGVTGSEAAKMLLVAAGYDPAIEGLTGTDWEINTNALASKLGIFRNFKGSVAEPLSRDNAALLIYNALDVEMIESYTNNGYAMAYSDARTILSSMYGVYKVEGVVVGNKWAELDKTDSDSALKDGKTVLDNVVLYSSTTSNTTKDEGVAQSGKIAFNVDTPVDFLGKTVTMYIEKTTILSDSKVLGVSTKDDVNVINATAATQSTVKDYLKGTGVAVTKGTEFYVNYGYCKTEEDAHNLINDYSYAANNSDKFNLNGVDVEIIDNNNDGDAEYVLFTRETLSEVRTYSEKNETISFYAPGYDKNNELANKTVTETEDFEDVVFNDEVTTDDLILYVQYGGRTYISAPEVVTGKMTRVDRDKADELFITVDGEEYRQSYILDAASLVDVDLTRFDIADAKNEPGFDNSYDFVLDSNGYVIAIRPAEEVVTNYALVVDSAWTLNALDRSGQVKILMTDGTVKTYSINWKNSAKAMEDINTVETTNDVKGKPNDEKLETYLGTRDVNKPNAGGYNKTGVATGSIITYTLSDDDVLTIKHVLQGNTLKGNDSEIDSSVNTSSTAGVADNGTVIRMNTSVDQSLQYTAPNGYTGGRGSITVKAGAEDAKTYAVDKNTVAFYYWTNAKGETEYGVATGWDHMSDVANNTEVQVYPTLDKTSYKTYEATDLADVILFEAEAKATSANYMLVLSANAIGKDLLELNVVFEDGTVQAIEVDDDGGHDWDDEASYMKAYTYAENADGTYDIGDDVENAGTAKLLKNGTVDSSLKGYIALSGKANVWDVTDVDTAEDKTALGTFPYNTKVNAVIVEDDNAIRTAWIWEVEEDDNDIDDNNPIATEVTKIDADNFKIYLNAFVGADNRVAVITRAMEKAGYTDVTFASAANNEYTVTAQVKSSSGISTSLTFTTVTRWFSDSAIGAENVDNYNNAADLPDNSALIGDGSDLATITGGSVGTDITAGDNMMFTYTTKGTGNVVLTISDRSGVVYRETHGTAGSPSASVAAGQHYFYISLDNGSLNTSSTSNKVDTANDKCTFAGKLADGNYVWSVTENGTTVASGSFTLDRGV